MKYTTFLLFICLVAGLTGCDQPIDFDKERASIIEVINKETTAYIDRDFDAVFSTHVHDSLNIRLSAGPDNYVFLEGWDDVAKHLSGDETEDDLNENLHISVEKSNYRMKIYPNSAWVVCDQKWTSQYDEDITEINSIQIRFMEKIDGEWKIALISFIGTSGYDALEQTERLPD